jgi:hypothetical protein
MILESTALRPVAKTGARARRNSGGDDTLAPSFRRALAFLNIAENEKISKK